jgi:acetyl-CoA carboxylase carboxyl transferase subunit beta
LTQKKYADRLKDVMEKLNLKTRTYWSWKIKSSNLLWIFAYLYEGSMGAVVGENLKRNQSFYQEQIPFIMISKSGGTRILMRISWSEGKQSIKRKLAQLAEEKIPYISYVQTLLWNDCILCYVKNINISEPGI